MISGWYRAASFAVLIGIAATAPSLSSERGGQDIAPPDAFAKAHMFLLATYPSLGGRGLMFTIGADQWREIDLPILPLTGFVITIGSSPGRSSRGTVPERLFAARFEFTADGRLYDFMATDSEFINSTKQKALDERAAEHPDWSATQLEQAIREAGAKFGPGARDAMEREVRARVRAWSSTLGPGNLESLDFYSDSMLVWKALVTAGGTKYSAVFEPFDGKLIVLAKIR